MGSAICWQPIHTAISERAVSGDRLVWADSELHLVDLTSGEQLSTTTLDFDIDSIEAASGSGAGGCRFRLGCLSFAYRQT